MNPKVQARRMGILKDLTGQRFGDAVAVRPAGKNKWGQSFWLLKCDCGKQFVALATTFQQHGNKCGGCQTCRYTQGGKSQKHYREFTVWRAMIVRCYDPKAQSYPWYGARGITVCPEWTGDGGFVQFFADMGRRLKGMSLDRKNPEGPYCKKNCRWADKWTQSENKRCNYSPEELKQLQEAASETWGIDEQF